MGIFMYLPHDGSKTDMFGSSIPQMHVKRQLSRVRLDASGQRLVSSIQICAALFRSPSWAISLDGLPKSIAAACFHCTALGTLTHQTESLGDDGLLVPRLAREQVTSGRTTGIIRTASNMHGFLHPDQPAAFHQLSDCLDVYSARNIPTLAWTPHREYTH